MSYATFILSRIQFGFTIGFHILFPTLNIGLAVFLCIMEGLWLKTANDVYLRICKYWTKIFALTFGMGVVSGIVLAYELGTNFGNFTAVAGNVLGPLFAYEVMSAFFLEAGFLGIMLFGWKRVNPNIHYLATLLVTIGTLISAFWIMSANSWMQSPSGYHLEHGKFVVDNWFEVVFNPTFIPRYLHMVFASLLTATFVITGVSAWFLMKQQNIKVAKICFSFALGAAVIIAPAQLLIGDAVGLVIREKQPLKTAAIEGAFRTQRGAPFVVFAIPDVAKGKNWYEIDIPKAASFINTHHWDGLLEGMNAFPKKDWPNVPATFYGFRIMLAIGTLYIAIAFYSVYLRWRKELYAHRFFLRLCLLTSPLGFVAAISGWITAETGRQPWVIYGMLRTSQAVSDVPPQQIFISLALFIVGYGVIFYFYLYYLFKLIRKGSEDLEQPPLTISYLHHPKDEAPT